MPERPAGAYPQSGLEQAKAGVTAARVITTVNATQSATCDYFLSGRFLPVSLFRATRRTAAGSAAATGGSANSIIFAIWFIFFSFVLARLRAVRFVGGSPTKPFVARG